MKYHSFEAIDQDLRILKLKRKIEEEKLKLAVEQVKQEIYPTNLLGGLAPLVQKIAISVIAKKVLQKLH